MRQAHESGKSMRRLRAYSYWLTGTIATTAKVVGRTPWSARDALVPLPAQRYRHLAVLALFRRLDKPQRKRVQLIQNQPDSPLRCALCEDRACGSREESSLIETECPKSSFDGSRLLRCSSTASLLNTL